MKVWWIQCAVCGKRWSRNRWGTVNSMPDLYCNHANANRQITDGKIALGVRYAMEGVHDCDVHAMIVEGDLE